MEPSRPSWDTEASLKSNFGSAGSQVNAQMKRRQQVVQASGGQVHPGASPLVRLGPTMIVIAILIRGARDRGAGRSRRAWSVGRRGGGPGAVGAAGTPVALIIVIVVVFVMVVPVMMMASHLG